MKIGIGGGNQAHIDLPRARRAQPFDLAGFEHAQQFCLLPDGHISDFVQKNRAAVGQFEAADAIGARVGKSAFHVAEKFAFK